VLKDVVLLTYMNFHAEDDLLVILRDELWISCFLLEFFL